MSAGLARKAALVLLAGGLITSLGACRSSGTTHRPTVASSTAQVPQSHGIPKSAFANLESFTGPAVTKFGLANVQAAYEEMVNFVFATGWDPAIIRKSSTTLAIADFAYAHSYMTPKFRKAFDATFAKVVQADKPAIQKLEHAMFFGVGGPNGAKPVQSGHVVTDRRFTKATLDIDKSQGYDRLSVTFKARANIQIQDAAGKRSQLPAVRTVQYWLVRNTGATAKDRPFLIDSWAIRLSSSPPQVLK